MQNLEGEEEELVDRDCRQRKTYQQQLKSETANLKLHSHSCRRNESGTSLSIVCLSIERQHVIVRKPRQHGSDATVPPVSCHWSCQSGESNLRAQISGDLQAGIRLRPVNSMHLDRKKGSPRCAVKLSLR